MLHFVMGIAGTGKTCNIIEKIREAAAQSERVIYLVPEQYSFEAERQMHRRLGAKLALNVEVLSFTRCANSIFRAYGGLAGTSLSKAAKHLLMSIAVGEVRENLSVYRKSCANTAFLETLVTTCGEFKTAGITCGFLDGFAKSCGDDALRGKLSELAIIYTAYQSLIDRGYSDPDDDLIRACALLENNCFFENALVFVDGFTTFMAAEFEFLGHIIAQAKDSYFAVTADEISDRQRGTGVFSTAKSAVNRLSRYAADRGVPVSEPEILPEPVRFLRPELAHIARYFMQPAAPAYTCDYTGALELSSALGAYDELDAAAFKITELVREKGLKYGEIAVIARDAEMYSRMLDDAFSRHGIPYFLSVSDDIENKPLISCVLSAINAVRGGFDPTLVLLFAKSPLLALEAEEIALLENYCYCWGVRGTLWKEDFSNNPRGLAGELTEDDLSNLARINSTRNAVITPLLRLREAMGGSNGQAFASGIFELLNEINATENIIRYAKTLPQSDAFLDDAAQLWDSLIEILDIFGTALGAYHMTAAQLCDLFRIAVGFAEITSPPQTLDQVLVGSADRIRPETVRAVFIIGANENVFPAQTASLGMFSDAERGVLINAGLEISAPSLQKSVLEKYFAYFALTLSSEWLYVSYSRSDLKGRELLPSAIITQLTEMFPGLAARERDVLFAISTEASAFRALSRNYREDTELSATLRAYFAGGDRAATLERMRRAECGTTHKIVDESAAKALFGSFMRLSPSRVERFYKCPFSYFVSDGLKIRKRGKVEFTGLESGSVIHHVLQVMLQKHGGKELSELSDNQITSEISEIIREYLAGLIDSPEKLPARLRFLFNRLSGMLTRLLRRLGEELFQSDFTPAAFELLIKTGGEVEPLRLETADGATVIVEGIVDRVDVMNKNGRRYIRVIDYKSGAKSFALHDVLYGINMQMLLYLFTISENGGGIFSDSIPAGVLYMPSYEKYVSAVRDSDNESVRKTREKTWRMSGILLDDEEALRGMERDIAGIYIPAMLDKSGNLDSASSLASRAELGALARKVKEQITKMAEFLGKGAIDACPIDENGRLTCEYCDYSAVCGFESGDPAREIAKLDREKFFKLLEEEERDAGAGMDKGAE